jgi:hypothetical protein
VGEGETTLSLTQDQQGEMGEDNGIRFQLRRDYKGDGDMKTQMSLVKVVMVLMAVGMAGSAFAAATAVTAVSPTSGPTGGGQNVRIYGAGFTNASVITVAGVAVAHTTFTANTIDFVSPVGVAGATDIQVDAIDGGNLYTYVSRNNKLVVLISATVANRAQIQWGDFTTLDDTTPTAIDHTVAPDRITNYAWTVKDNSIGVIAGVQQIDLATNYRSDDLNNGKTINVSNVSSIAGSSCTISAVATGGAPYTLAAATGALDKIAVKGSMGGAAMATLNAPVNLTAALVVGTDQPLVLEFDSPATISLANKGVTAVTTVTLTATGN